ncbi:tandem-95 repeat protein [Tenacibaculum sp. nBUS_03]|uniref:tandem-95 repeat protein n=1 Tax=Tenacibaculum sp. nBUS_03 TaxID=3395320 RepID=UPI003EBA6F0E
MYTTDQSGLTITNDGCTADQVLNLTINDSCVNTTDAIVDISNTYVDESVSGNVLTNDEDLEGNTQTVSSNTNPSNGTVTISSNGEYTYTPNAGFTGEDTFTYTVCDNGSPQACDTTTVTIEVIPETSVGVNDGPIANNDTGNTEVGIAVSGNLISNDFDPNGDPLTINTTPVTNPSNGTVTINADGTYTYTPNPGFTGEDTFEYEVCDNGSPALCSTAVVTITVSPVDGTNDSYAHDDAFNGDSNSTISGNVLSNDTDPEGNIQTVTTTPVTGPSNGTLIINSDGTFVYTPTTGYSGTDSFVYEVCDNGTPVVCDKATVYLTVNPVNTTDAVVDIANTYVDESVSGNVLTNDEDLEGNTQTVSSNTNPSNGTVTISSNGEYTYTPNAGFTGEDTFTYTVCDNGSPQACDTTTVTIEVIPETSVGVNDGPIANNDTGNTEVGIAVSGNLISNDFDPNGDPLTINTTPVTNPSNGTVTINADGTYTYTPNPGFTGEDTFEYEVCDNGSPALCSTAVVTITVSPVDGTNDSYAHDDAFNGDSNSTISGNVLSNDTDPEGNIQTVTTTPVTGPSNGTLIINSDGTFIYTPTTGYSGTDSFVYEVCDNGTPVVCDQATVYLTVNPVNTTDAVVDIANTYVDESVSGNVLTNDEDLEGNTQTVSSNTNPSNGTVTISSNGEYTYTPNAGFTGEDTFTYTVCDNGSPQACDTTTVTIEVIPETSVGVNDGPIANNDTGNTEVGIAVSGNLISNDFDPNGDPLTINTTPVTNPSNGTVTINADGTYTYTPNPGFTGEDTFEYEVCDNGSPALCSTAVVTITVSPVDGTNDSYAHDDAFNGDSNSTISGNVLSNDTDPEGNIQTVTTTPVTGPSNGTLIINSDGTFVYTPTTGYSGTDSFVYEVCDNGTPVVCDQATVYLTVNPVTETDTDGDGVPDNVDEDDDNDGISDVDEGSGDNNATGDEDGDGIPNWQDTTDNGNTGDSSITDYTDSNADGIPDVYDTDGDGVPNHLDLDSDNDGILDVDEGGNGDLDTNGDGVIDSNDTGYSDANGDGQDDDSENITEPDTDEDGVPDYLDLDSDNDGINDVIEDGNVDNDNDGIADGGDADGDGIVDSADNDDSGFGEGNGGEPDNTDTDGDGVPDYNDLDSDDDGVNDVEEGGNDDVDGNGLVDGPDTDGDGILDVVDEDDNNFGDSGNSDVNDTDPTDPNDGGTGVVDDSGTDSDGDGISDSEDGANGTFGDAIDTDGDGIPDNIDVDDDNDGIADVDEGSGDNNATGDEDGDGIPNWQDTSDDGDAGDGSITDYTDSNGDGIPDVYDTDGDGVPNHLDLDSDNDGILDVDEGGNGALDTNGDGVIDSNDTGYSDANGDGQDDDSENITEPDTDGDGVPDYLDLDSDNDGINDVIEDGNVDVDNDGIADGADVDGDGIVDSVDNDDSGFGEGNDGEPDNTDTDGDGVPDYLDLDSDDDGVNDVEEGGNEDEDGNGLVDGPDSDGDGILDVVDEDDSNFGDSGNSDVNDTDPTDPNSGGNGVVSDSGIDSDGDGIADSVDGDDTTFGDSYDCITVFNEFSPNGDGVNDALQIDCIENYKNNTIEIFNRWGNTVYKAKGYNNEDVSFKGVSNGRVNISVDSKLPVGTYFYVLDLGDGSAVKKGWIYINR